MKRLLFCMLLASGVVLLHAQAQAAEKKSPEAQLTAAQAVPAADVASDTTVAKPAIKVFRDYDWSKGGYGTKDVNIQSAAYKAARDKYKSTWAVKDVQACSDLAFTSETAAWPWINLVDHICETGHLEERLDDVQDYLKKAEVLVGSREDGDAAKIKDIIEHKRDWIAENL